MARYFASNVTVSTGPTRLVEIDGTTRRVYLSPTAAGLRIGFSQAEVDAANEGYEVPAGTEPFSLVLPARTELWAREDVAVVDVGASIPVTPP